MGDAARTQRALEHSGDRREIHRPDRGCDILLREKDKVYAEAYRVLRSGGRMMVSDVVLERALSQEVLQSIDAWVGCGGGASLREPYLQTIRDAGFSELRVDREACFADAIDLDDPALQEAMVKLGIDRAQAREYGRAVTSLHVFARK